uniref:Uncharacterized protein n=1 Tax=Peronospora matthiolae TaxID=2874970 RepID=A0AAV1UZC3_9STRA
MNIKGILVYVMASVVIFPVASQFTRNIYTVCNSVEQCFAVSDVRFYPIFHSCEGDLDPKPCCNRKCTPLNCANVKACQTEHVTKTKYQDYATNLCSIQFSGGKEFNDCCIRWCVNA